jgi:phage-related protein
VASPRSTNPHTLNAALSDSVYVLHAFQKKSKSGRETRRRDMELIEQRLREAEQIAKRNKS